MAPGFVTAFRTPQASLRHRRRIILDSQLKSTVSTVDTAGNAHADALPSNRVVTSRYTLLTFVPMNLWEQLQRPMNMYFVAVSVLLCFPVIAPVSPITVMAPLLIAFAIAGAKEAVDDLHRHRGDTVTNSRVVWRVDCGARLFRAVPAETLNVGDVILLLKGDPVPCDIIPLLSDDPLSGNVYCNTANLDGEADAKIKHALLANRVRLVPEAQDVSRQAKEELSLFPSMVNGANGTITLPPALELLFRFAVAGLTSLVVECEPPSRVLSSFVGELHVTLGSDTAPLRAPLTMDNLIVSTSSIVNSTFMLGCVIYTGNESKVHRSRKDQPPKWSVMERLTNKFAVSIFVLQMLGVVVMSILFYVNLHTHRAWYLQSSKDRPDFHVAYTPLRCFLLMSIMVPLSVKITLELSKFYISQLIEWDLELYDEATDTPAIVNNRALAEELGLVQFVLADKTGTLTENSMTLRAIAFATVKAQLFRVSDEGPATADPTYGGTGSENRDVSRRVITSHTMDALWRDTSAQHLLRAILCNNSCEITSTDRRDHSASSVRFSTPRSDNFQLSFQSTSPDEVALVSGLSRLGVTLQDRTHREVQLRVGTLGEVVQILATAPFSSSRGAMSVLIRREGSAGSVLYVKGSDDRLGLMRTSADPSWESIAKMVDELAAEGLRTLVFGYKELSDDETNVWLDGFHKAELIQDAAHRVEAIAACWGGMETDVRILGATAVEDILQADVPATIAALRQANIRVWMLTGDKHSTAIQTGRLSGLLTDSDPIYTFDVNPSDSVELQRHALSRQLKSAFSSNSSDTESLASLEAGLLAGRTEAPPSLHPFTTRAGQLDTADSRDYKIAGGAAYTIVITGRALRVIEAAGSLMCDFDPVLFQAATVICCRVTPDQKALIVALIRRRGVLCLAIGDGGNDVPMIQEADVGVGIAGSEGRQAVQASDYAISKFRFLAPLLLTHGHTAVMRSAYLVQYIFYKSIIIGLIQALYNSTCTLSSGVSFFDSVALTLYNGVFTLVLSYLPVLDTHLPRAVLRADPSLYQLSQSGHYMNRGTFQRHILKSIVHAVLLFYAAKMVFSGDFVGSEGRPYAILDGEYVSVLVPLVLIQCAIVAIESHSITILHAVFIPLSFVSFFVLYAPYSAWLKKARFYGLFDTWMGHPPIWLATVLIAGVVLIPFCFVAAVKFHVKPDQLQLWRQKLFMGQDQGLRFRAARRGNVAGSLLTPNV